MVSFILKQPDGKFAAFCTVEDDFTAYGMDEAEALEMSTQDWGATTAREKVANAIADKTLGRPHDDGSNGLGRWRSALTDIAMVHGLDYLRTRLAEIGFPDAEIPQSAIDAVVED